MSLGNWVQETTATTGTGTMTLVAVSEFAEFVDAVAEGTVVDYAIFDDNGDKETGRGTTGALKTLARTTVESTLVSGTYDNTTPTAITLSGSATVILAIAAENIVDKYNTSFANQLYRDDATFRGDDDSTHINLGHASFTGTVGQSYTYPTVLSGLANLAAHNYSTVVGGNVCYALGAFTFVGNGSSNTANGSKDFIGNGASNDITAGHGAIVCGKDNDNTGVYGFIGAGLANNVSGDYSGIPNGRGCLVSHTHAMVINGAGASRANYDFIIGATDSSTASNANNTIRLEGTGGNVKIDGAVTSPEADYAETYEWLDSNINNEDRVGYFVYAVGEKIVKGNLDVEGVISANPAIVGDGAPNHWQGMWLRDEWNRALKVSYSLLEWVDEWGDKQYVYESQDGTLYNEYPQPTNVTGFISALTPIGNIKSSVIETKVINPAYDVSQAESYEARGDRQTHDYVGSHGKLFVRTAELIISDYVDADINGEAINGTTYKVLKVVSDKIARIRMR